jgi:hypothetical protein
MGRTKKQSQTPKNHEKVRGNNRKTSAEKDFEALKEIQEYFKKEVEKFKNSQEVYPVGPENKEWKKMNFRK